MLRRKKRMEMKRTTMKKEEFNSIIFHLMKHFEVDPRLWTSEQSHDKSLIFSFAECEDKDLRSLTVCL